MEKAEKLAVQGRHEEAVQELTAWLKDHGPSDRAHAMLMSEQRKAERFRTPAGAIRISARSHTGSQGKAL